MRSTFLLLEDIRLEMERAVENMVFRRPPSAPERYVPPSVLIGHVPPKRSQPATDDKPDSEPPFVLIRELDGELKADGDKAFVHEVKVGVLCCTFSDESFTTVQDGYQDIANLKDTVLLALWGRRYWADNFWRLELPIKWTSGLDKARDTYAMGSQFHPYYGAAVIGTFVAAAPPMPRVPGVDVHG